MSDRVATVVSALALVVAVAALVVAVLIYGEIQGLRLGVDRAASEAYRTNNVLCSLLPGPGEGFQDPRLVIGSPCDRGEHL
jgi:hypothetical protein